MIHRSYRVKGNSHDEGGIHHTATSQVIASDRRPLGRISICFQYVLCSGNDFLPEAFGDVTKHIGVPIAHGFAWFEILVDSWWESCKKGVIDLSPSFAITIEFPSELVVCYFGLEEHCGGHPGADNACKASVTRAAVA